jgi:hypothetical protein
MPPTGLPDDLLQTLDLLVQVLNDAQTDYALIGGLGVALRGTIRTTRDVDLLLSVPQLALPGLLEQLQQCGFQLDLTEAITAWHRDHLLHFHRGEIGVDWLQTVLPVFQRILSRAQWETIGGRPIRVADAEGLLLLKLIAFRLRDQEDIHGILAANPGALDLDWVRQEWSQLVSPEDERTAQFEQMVHDFYDPRSAG